MSPFGMYYPNELVDLESLTDDNEKMIAQWQRNRRLEATPHASIKT